MGLSIYAFTTTQPLSQATDSSDNLDHFFEWTGHWSLARWIEIIYRLRGHHTENFIGVAVRLAAVDLDNLGKALADGEIEPAYSRYITVGGSPNASDDRLFLRAARETIASGKHVYCACCW